MALSFTDCKFMQYILLDDKIKEKQVKFHNIEENIM